MMQELQVAETEGEVVRIGMKYRASGMGYEASIKYQEGSVRCRGPGL